MQWTSYTQNYIPIKQQKFDNLQALVPLDLEWFYSTYSKHKFNSKMQNICAFDIIILQENYTVDEHFQKLLYFMDILFLKDGWLNFL